MVGSVVIEIQSIKLFCDKFSDLPSDHLFHYYGLRSGQRFRPLRCDAVFRLRGPVRIRLFADVLIVCC